MASAAEPRYQTITQVRVPLAPVPNASNLFTFNLSAVGVPFVWKMRLSDSHRNFHLYRARQDVSGLNAMVFNHCASSVRGTIDFWRSANHGCPKTGDARTPSYEFFVSSTAIVSAAQGPWFVEIVGRADRPDNAPALELVVDTVNIAMVGMTGQEMPVFAG